MKHGTLGKRTYACENKHKYSFAQARSAAAKARRRSKHKIVAYRCGFCSAYISGMVNDPAAGRQPRQVGWEKAGINKASTMSDIKLTRKEERAIERLERLAKSWPKSLTLFSQSGSLEVMKIPKDHIGDRIQQFIVAYISGIPNDGGDSD